MNARHAQLFAQYLEELKTVKTFVELWWDNLIAIEPKNAGDHDDAALEVGRRWRAGPVSHPRVIALIRKYYFECERLNEEMSEAPEEDLEADEPHHLPGEEDYDEDEDENEDEEDDEEGDEGDDEGPINPSLFLGEFLVNPKTEDLAFFMSKLTYWPIGMDLEGNLV